MRKVQTLLATVTLVAMVFVILDGSPTPVLLLWRRGAGLPMVSTTNQPSTEPAKALEVPGNETPTAVDTAAPLLKIQRLPSAQVQAPGLFTTTLLASYVTPQPYVDNLCEYLRAKWDPERSSPGTVVVPIMFHSVQEHGTYKPGDTFILANDLERTVEAARSLGFVTITAEQLAAFLEDNCAIPRRSMIWIVDDRRPDCLQNYFVPIAKANGWTITLGWIVGNTDWIPGLWEKVEAWTDQGWVDVQSHGLEHRYITVSTPDEIIREELFDSIAPLKEHTGSRPVAYVWPGGNYTPRALTLAREAGYRLGFTINSRGPLMYNWVPLADKEAELGDPLLLLPRYWSTPNLPAYLANAAAIGDEAAEQARRVYRLEALYYETYCGCSLPDQPKL